MKKIYRKVVSLLIATLFASTLQSLGQVIKPMPKNFDNGKLNWQHPLPQGNGLLGVKALNEKVVYVGSSWAPILAKTIDGGDNWELIELDPKGGPADGFDFIDENTGWITSSKGQILKTTDGCKNFVTISLANENYTINRLVFRDKDNGYALGTDGEKSLLLESKDGGANWKEIVHPELGTLYHFQNFGSDTLITFGYTSNDFVPTLLHSVDAGKNWTKTITDPLYIFRFSSGQKGFIAGSKDSMAVTVDGSKTFKGFNIGDSDLANGQISWIHFVDKQVGFASSMYPIKFYKTTNGGESWVNVGSISREISSWTYMSYFINENVGWSVGGGGHIHKTIDGGKNWTSTRKSIFNESFWGVDFVSNQKGWAVGNKGAIVHTENAGNVWKVQNSNSSKTLRSIKMISDISGWAVGDTGAVLKTTDGLLWSKSQQITAENLNSICAWNKDTLITVGNKGTIILSENGGTSWKLISNVGTKQNLKAVAFACKNVAYAVGDTGTVLKSMDGGQSWKVLQSPVINNLNAITVISADTFWIAATKAKILKSVDGGTSWEEQFVNSMDGASLLAIKFINHNDGYVFGQYGAYFKTANGGEDWEEVVTNVKIDIYGVDFSDANNAWLVGRGALITKYTDTKENPKLHSNTTCIDLMNTDSPLNIKQFNVYPLPASSKVYFENKPQNSTLKIYNCLGEIIAQIENADSWDIPMNVPSGVYSFILDNKGQYSRGKLSIIK